MNSKDIQRIAVIGAGQMGHQIGMLCALGGYETIIQDMNEPLFLFKKETDSTHSICPRYLYSRHHLRGLAIV